MEPTPKADLERYLKELNENKDRWVALDIPARIRLLRRAMSATRADAEAQVRSACRAKGIDFDSTTSAEEWLGGPMTTMRNMRLLVDTLNEVQTNGRPAFKSSALRKRHDGQMVAKVFPQNGLDKALYTGFTGEIYFEPGATEDEIMGSMARIYRPGGKGEGKIALVLGAGNVASIGPMDVLHKLFSEDQVCVLKMNPVNEYLGPHIERGFAPFIEEGFLRVVYGGADVGDLLVKHELIDEIHITGSDRVHDIIVWGAGEEGEKNKAANKPRMDKRITSELGCVTPIIVVPGQWTQKELAFQAANVATMVANNASFNCNAAKIVLTWGDWPQRAAFLQKVEETLGTLPTRRAYYPGSDAKYEAFIEAHPKAKRLAPKGEDVIPWTTIFNVDSANAEDIVFNREAWCAILAEATLPARDAREFLKKVVEFANEKVWGTLSCTIIADPRTQKRLGSDFEQALADLRYGSVAVNHWAALSYGLCVTTWGAHPGHTMADIRSGIGVVHNTLMFENVQKSVIRGPMTVFPKPPWFANHKNAHNVARRLVDFEYEPTFWKVPFIAFGAMRG